ncbi:MULTISPECIES: hypothetical protein [unclassified Actinomyces]|uniref:hypothetical protein n=1 Tax=unclassified Actinomyces TaxID=2609248 RepID=UPI0020174CAC|nr:MULTISPECIES: hypothetical protein [unclassified Actinomyces]MCL3777068.1 hypothetical protein [Actinomyces sp. AC-20-1]MCL3790288.1 hypothetical protein [Actinomyces sp. 187325]MCL3791289.1 hypothetical protein [Actinomyces sp. 186855]MCL3793792.1 hypothetical protein [Actinomyces sp. 217892]
MALSGGRRPQLRAEPGLRGYRAMIAVLVITGLVILGAVTGAFHRLLCLADSSACGAPAPAPVPTGAVALPAASDERVVVAAAAAGVVAGGHRDTVAGRSPVTLAQAVPAWSQMWGEGRPQAAPASRFEGAGVLVALEDLACGAPGTGSCDTWDALASDPFAERATGLLRAPLLGLDPADPSTAQPVVVDLDLGVRPDAGLDAVDDVLHRSVLTPATGVTTLTWTWQRPDGALIQVRAERLPDGSLTALAVCSLAETPTGLERTELVVPVTPTSWAAVESWLVELAGQRVDPDPVALTGTDPADMSVSAFERLAAQTGQGLRESVILPEGESATAERLRADPLLEGAERLPLAERPAGGEWVPAP